MKENKIPAKVYKPTNYGKKSLDVIYFIEASENILAYHWTEITNWMTQLSNQAQNLNQDIESMAIVIRFKSYNSDQFKNFLNRKVQEMEHKTGFTVIIKYLTDDNQDSYDALNYVVQTYAPELRHNSNKILISLTDGLYRTQSVKSASQKAAIMSNAHSAFNTMIAVGYGSNMNQQELKNWAWSSGHSTFGTYFLLKDISEIESINGQVLKVLN